MKNTSNKIPPITSALGLHWEQPALENILVDDTHAVLSAGDFARLKEYTFTNPTGVYDGKMWRRYTGDGWALVWYGTCEKPDHSAIEWRKILIVD